MNWQERAEKAEDVLRSLASFVGAGGYNADKVDADVFEQKIRWGIGQIMERLEKAEAELARMREHEREWCAQLCEWLPVGTGYEGKTFAEAIRGKGLGAKLAEGFIPSTFLMITAPVPEQREGKLAMAAPAVPDNNWKRFTDDDLAEIHQLSYELGGTDSGEYLLDGDQLDQIVVKCASLFYAFPVKAAPAPAPAVPDDRVSQDDAALMQAASGLALYRAGESAEYMAKAIEALLQSATQSDKEV